MVGVGAGAGSGPSGERGPREHSVFRQHAGRSARLHVASSNSSCSMRGWASTQRCWAARARSGAGLRGGSDEHHRPDPLPPGRRGARARLAWPGAAWSNSSTGRGGSHPSPAKSSRSTRLSPPSVKAARPWLTASSILSLARGGAIRPFTCSVPKRKPTRSSSRPSMRRYRIRMRSTHHGGSRTDLVRLGHAHCRAVRWPRWTDGFPSVSAALLNSTSDSACF